MKNVKKIVIYNGGKDSYYGCDEPNELVVGQKYVVVSETDLGFQTNYVLKGVDGEYNSCWFDEPDSKVYLAVGYSKPVVGERYDCNLLKFDDDRPILKGWLTSTVRAANYLGNQIYEVKTRTGSTYIVKLPE